MKVEVELGKALVAFHFGITLRRDQDRTTTATTVITLLTYIWQVNIVTDRLKNVNLSPLSQTSES